jgi:hypothetical protein
MKVGPVAASTPPSRPDARRGAWGAPGALGFYLAFQGGATYGRLLLAETGPRKRLRAVSVWTVGECPLSLPFFSYLMLAG